MLVSCSTALASVMVTYEWLSTGKAPIPERKNGDCGSNVSRDAVWNEVNMDMFGGVDGIISENSSVSVPGLCALLQLDNS